MSLNTYFPTLLLYQEKRKMLARAQNHQHSFLSRKILLGVKDEEGGAVDAVEEAAGVVARKNLTRSKNSVDSHPSFHFRCHYVIMEYLFGYSALGR